MAKLSDEDLAYCRKLLNLLEPSFQRRQSIVNSLPANDPEATLTRAWLQRWETLSRAVQHGGGDVDHDGLIKEIAELDDALPDLSSTRAPFAQHPAEAARAIEEVRNACRSAGYTDQESALVLDQACKPQMGAPRKDRCTAFKALRMHIAGKFYPEIANELCLEHGNNDEDHRRTVRCARDEEFNPHSSDMKLDKCSEMFRDQIKDLKKVLSKYTTPSR